MCKCCDPSEKQLKGMRTVRGFNEWDEEYSMVEELLGECVVNIPRTLLTRITEHDVDEKFGLIAIIMLHVIPCDGVERKKEMFTFSFAKKYTKRIKKIEEVYLSGKMQVDAKQMSMAFTSVLNSMIKASLINVRPFRTSSTKKTKKA